MEAGQWWTIRETTAQAMQVVLKMLNRVVWALPNGVLEKIHISINKCPVSYSAIHEELNESGLFREKYVNLSVYSEYKK